MKILKAVLSFFGWDRPAVDPRAAWTQSPEARAKMSKRMKAYWAKKRKEKKAGRYDYRKTAEYKRHHSEVMRQVWAKRKAEKAAREYIIPVDEKGCAVSVPA